MTASLIGKAQRMYDARRFTMAEIATSGGVNPDDHLPTYPHRPTTETERRTINTNLNDHVDDDPHVQHFLDTEVPMRRWAAPAELTGAALLLTDPQAGYLTGAVLPVDGGWTAH